MTFLKAAAFLILVIFYNVEAAPSKCGKQSLRINYGQTRTFTSPDLETPSSCKYRIKAPKGFDIKLTYSDFNSDPCCSQYEIYNAAKKPFRWLSKQILEKPTDVVPGTVVQYQTYMLGIKHDITTPGEPKVSFTYEAVVPEDGNCGFRTTASSSKKVIRSPGFPRSKSKSGLECNWVIKSKDGNPIVLTLTGLNTASVSDYVEVFEGDRRIALHTGKLPSTSPIEHIVHSGKMRVYFHTTTSQSKGFKATYQTLEVTTTDIGVSVGGEESTGLKCHKRSKVSSMGKIMDDVQSTIICPVGSKCGYMVMEGMSYGITVQNENANCIPANMCIDNAACNMQTPPPEITVKSCKVTCCSTTMCNDSPDGPPATPEGGVFPGPSISPGKVTQCDFTSEVMDDLGRIMASSSPGQCTSDTVCVLYKWTGDFPTGKKARGAVGKCGLRSECTRDACNNIQESRFIDIKTCEVSCCETDYCNDVQKFGGLRSDPPVPPVSRGLQCDQSTEVNIGSEQMGAEEGSDCPPDTICALFRYKGPAIVSAIPGTMVSGYTTKCTPRSQCNREGCNNIHAKRYVDIKTCEVTCCETDFCNNPKPTISPPASRIPPMPFPEASGLNCIQSSDVYAGDRSASGRTGGYSCPVDTVCALYTFSGTSTQLDGSVIPASGYSAKCAPESACNPAACDELYEAEQMTITTCDIKCCKTDKCNKPPPPPGVSPSPPIMPPVSGGGSVNECYDIMISRAGSMEVINNKKASKCLMPDSSCVRIDAVASTPSGLKAQTIYGACVPTITCGSLDCSSMGAAMSGLKLESCDASCCHSNLCNGESSPSAPSTPVKVGSDSEDSDSEDSNEGRQCYDLLQVEAPGMQIPGGKRIKSACDSGSACLKIKAIATHDLIPSMEITTTYGSCIPSIVCNSMDCSSLPSAMANVTIKSCDVSCCSTDFCNG